MKRKPVLLAAEQQQQLAIALGRQQLPVGRHWPKVMYFMVICITFPEGLALELQSFIITLSLALPLLTIFSFGPLASNLF